MFEKPGCEYHGGGERCGKPARHWVLFNRAHPPRPLCDQHREEIETICRQDSHACSMGLLSELN